ncbi:metallophosphoesterase family protein [Burkholderia sp. KJ006]|uniref:metallophosphoesterase family protein n=1 Tax=Burkholderia sp. KJ006 TaxID=416344 RepID=UPI000A02062D|nr:metallophosphoesterase [Burkholderia sp. KJ006]
MTIDGGPIIRLAIVSDLHAFASADKARNSVVDLSGSTPGRSNPLSDLIAAASKLNLSADVLVCAGDICNMADFAGLERAWDQLQRLRDALQASDIVVTCGNHDLDSRYLSDQTDPDPKGALLTLVPPFPFADEQLNDRFWARNYAITTLPSGVVMVSLNTSAFHGGAQNEIEHGRVSQRTINCMVRDLEATRNAPAHILVCHHHPMPLTGWDDKPDGEAMLRGQVLLDALTKATGSSWLVIHGHRHHPRLIQGATSSNEVPFVFGAASLGARLTGIPNQFHIMEVRSCQEADHAPLVGTVRTWSWTDSTNWTVARSSSGLPPLCGFGYRGQIKPLALKIENIVGSTFRNWKDIQSQVPSVNFLMPDSMRQLNEQLLELGLEILENRNGEPAQIGR